MPEVSKGFVVSFALRKIEKQNTLFFGPLHQTLPLRPDTYKTPNTGPIPLKPNSSLPISTSNESPALISTLNSHKHRHRPSMTKSLRSNSPSPQCGQNRTTQTINKSARVRSGQGTRAGANTHYTLGSRTARKVAAAQESPRVKEADCRAGTTRRFRAELIDPRAALWAFLERVGRGRQV